MSLSIVQGGLMLYAGRSAANDRIVAVVQTAVQKMSLSIVQGGLVQHVRRSAANRCVVVVV